MKILQRELEELGWVLFCVVFWAYCVVSRFNLIFKIVITLSKFDVFVGMFLNEVDRSSYGCGHSGRD